MSLSLSEFITIVSFGLMIISLLSFFLLTIMYGLKDNQSRPKFPRKSIYSFCFFLVLGSSSAFYTASIATNEVTNYISQISNYSQVLINGKEIKDSHKYLSMLRSLKYKAPAHNSSPTKLIKVSIVTIDNKLELDFFRDSKLPNEYWVFYPKYGIIAKKEIARVTTSVFEDF